MKIRGITPHLRVAVSKSKPQRFDSEAPQNAEISTETQVSNAYKCASRFLIPILIKIEIEKRLSSSCNLYFDILGSVGGQVSRQHKGLRTYMFTCRWPSMQASMCELMCLGRPVMPLLCNAAQLPGGLLTLAGPPVPFEGYARWQLAVLASSHQVCQKCSVQGRRFARSCKLTWLVLGEDPAARSHRVEQFTAL